MTPNYTLGTQLRRAREDAGMEQRAAAKAVGVHEVTLSKYENDRSVPGDATLAKLWTLYSQPAPDALPVAGAAPPETDGVVVSRETLGYLRGKLETTVDWLVSVEGQMGALGSSVRAVGETLQALRSQLDRATSGVSGLLTNGTLPAPRGPVGRPVMTEAEVEAQVAAFRRQQDDDERGERSA